MPRAGLDRERIVGTALDLVDEVGLDGLSTRVLARRLDVRSPALYWHFPSKTDLVAAMADAMIQQLPDAAASITTLGRRPSKRDVAGWLVDRAEQFRRILLSRRDGARIHAGSIPPPSRWDGVEAQLHVLTRLGLDVGAAGRVTVAVSRFVVGWVLEEQSSHPRAGTSGGTADHPLVTAAGVALEHDDPHEVFTRCVCAVVDGLLRRGV